MNLTKSQKMKGKIVTCAKELFATQGYLNTSMRQIASQMGFKNQASLYYYFRQKKAIGREVLNSYFVSLNHYLFSLPAVKEDPLLFLPLRETCSCHLMLMEPQALSFLSEADRDNIFTSRSFSEDHYFQPIFDLMKQRDPSWTATRIKIAISYYMAGFIRILREWDPDNYEIPVQEFIDSIPSVQLWFLHFNDRDIDTMVEKARLVFSNLPKEDLSRLSFF